MSSSPSIVERTPEKPSPQGSGDDVDEGLRAALGVLTEDQTLGRYELLTPIGRGGMAVVWAARLRGMHGFSKVVALKTMLPVLSSDPRFQAMFLAEAKIAARIEHPNVCEILDLGEDRGIVYLVMEAIDGEPLSRLEDTCIMQGRKVPCAVAARIIAQAARGLHAAHVLKSDSGEPSAVIHRDVSPQNVLVTCEGVVKIVDFGVARAAERSEHTTEAGFIKGKVAYLAPEQIECRAIDVRVDVFALGVVLHELLSGAHPFQGETDLATLLAIAAPEPAPRLPADDDLYPPQLRAIVERALEKDPAKRHPTMRELASALEAFASEVETSEEDVSAFVTEMLGERRAEQRRALREAARSADARRSQPDSTKTVAAAKSVEPAKTVEPTSAGAPAKNVEPASAVEPEMPAIHRPRSPMLAVVAAVGVLGIGLGALGLRASQVATEPPPPEPRLTARATTSPVSPAATGAPATGAMATGALASSASATSPAATTASAPMPAASVAVRSPSSTRPTTPTKSASATSPSGKSASPAPSAAPVKKTPLDGWD